MTNSRNEKLNSPDRGYYTVKNDHIIYCDVDHTLVITEPFNHEHVGEYDDTISDPYYPDHILGLIECKKNVGLLKRKHKQGFTIVVWSAGGVKWAQTIVERLGLESIVSIVLPKPVVYIDDLHVDDWGMSRIYLED